MKLAISRARVVCGVALALVLLLSCGRIGYELSQNPDGSPVLVLDQTQIVNALNSATFAGDCTAPLEVQIEGVGTVPCNAGRFQFTTPMETTDGVRPYNFAQETAAGLRSEATGTWVRDAAPAALLLDEDTIQNALDTATFSGTCSSSSGDVTVVGPSGSRLESCIGDRFSYTTDPETTDGDRMYLFDQTNAAGIRSQVSGRWIRNSAAPTLRLDEAFLFTGTDTVTFTGDCTEDVGGVSIRDGGANDTVACVGERFSYDTNPRSGDGIYEVTFSQMNPSGTSSVTGRWQRVTALTRLLTDGVAVNSGYGDSLASLEGDIFVGAPLDDTNFTNSGVVYRYELTPSGYSSPSAIFSPAPGNTQMFGEALASCGDQLLVGADCNSQGSCIPTIFVYRMMNGTLQLLQQIEGVEETGFANRIDCDGDNLVTGARTEREGGEVAGAVYVYRRQSDGRWGEPQRLTQSVPTMGARFGQRAAVDEPWLAVSNDLGPGFLFRLESGVWTERTSSADPGGLPMRPMQIVVDGAQMVWMRNSGSPYSEFGATNWTVEQTITGAGLLGESGDASGGVWALAAPYEMAGGTIRWFTQATGVWSEAGFVAGPPSTKIGSSETVLEGKLLLASDELRQQAFYFILP